MAGANRRSERQSQHPVYTQLWDGYSNWRCNWTWTIALPSAMLTSQKSFCWFRFGSQSESTSWDAATMRAARTWESDCAKKHGNEHALVPKVTAPASFTAGGWRTTSLGSCATSVDGGRNGFVLTGTASPDDARFSVVRTKDAAFVEVVDDALVAGAGAADMLDLELASSAETFMDAGFDYPPPTRVRVRMTDGAITLLAAGELASPPAIQMASFAGGRRVRVPIAESWALHVVYRDTDDGVSHERAIGTSKSAAHDALADSFTVGAGNRVTDCARVGDRLERWVRETPLVPVTR